jgi:catalase
MKNKISFPNTLAGLLVLALPPAFAAEPAVTAPQVVQAIENVFGVTPGQRRNHTKGSCVSGDFVGNPEVSKFSRSALFSGKPVPVIGRFSLAGGNPQAPDTARSPRGMALQFKLPGDQLHQMAMLNVPIFGAASPQTFLDLMIALKPDPATGKADPEKMKAFKASHPDSLALGQHLASHNPPASYASSSYWGIHTFMVIDRKERTTPVRWRFVPQDGEKRLSDAELKGSPANFLEQALLGRVQKGPVRWDMLLTIGEPGDPQDNPTLAWPSERQEIKAGTLSISAAMAEKGSACEAINFDPLVMADGIAPSNDPVLQFRSAAYAVSFAKRSGEK